MAPTTQTRDPPTSRKPPTQERDRLRRHLAQARLLSAPRGPLRFVWCAWDDWLTGIIPSHDYR